MGYRTKRINPDFAKHSGTLSDKCCFICGRRMKDGLKSRVIVMELDVFEVIHREDVVLAEKLIRERRKHREPIMREPIGMDCAKRLGLNWSI